uniref:F-box domain-containing protein n=1 Tax=Anopheles christyi TaxID=43041 RepID=A0A182KEV7_9DIPT
MNLNTFPNEVLCSIFDYLSWKDRQRVSLVCHRWNAIINSDHYLRNQKLVLYNYNKAKFFSGVSVELLSRQKNIAFFSNAMLDTEELLDTIIGTFSGGKAMVRSLSLFLRSEHRLARMVVDNIPNLHHLIELNISDNEALPYGVLIDSESLEKLNISFYQNSVCRLSTPRLHTLHLTVRYPSEMELISTISPQLIELKVLFISKDHVAKLFRCDFRSLKALNISLKNDKYISYSVSPVHLRPLEREAIFAQTIVGLETLRIVDMCNIFDIDFLKMFAYARSLKALTINYFKMVTEVFELINGFKGLENVMLIMLWQYLNLEGCQKTDDARRLALPCLQTLVMPYKQLSLFSSTQLHTLTTLYYNNTTKDQTLFIKQIADAFTNLTFLCLQHFDNELDPNAFLHLNLLTKLRVLVIENMSVSSHIFQNCPTVPQLQRLVMDTIVTEVSMLDVIPARFPALQTLVISNCFLYLIPQDSAKYYTTFDELRRQMACCRISTKDSTIFTNNAKQS